jgi:hypothetical protein
LRFQSDGAGIPNTLSGYIVAPLHQSENGNILFIDGFANWNFGGELSDSSFGASTRLGYRWLNDDRSWMLGANAGVDTTPYQGDYNWQAGLGLEALNRSVEIRANGYIPLSNSNEEVGRGYSGAYLSNNNLFLTGAGTHPGGGITGVPGRNAAAVALEQLGLAPRKPFTERARSQAALLRDAGKAALALRRSS